VLSRTLFHFHSRLGSPPVAAAHLILVRPLGDGAPTFVYAFFWAGFVGLLLAAGYELLRVSYRDNSQGLEVRIVEGAEIGASLLFMFGCLLAIVGVFCLVLRRLHRPHLQARISWLTLCCAVLFWVSTLFLHLYDLPTREGVVIHKFIYSEYLDLLSTISHQPVRSLGSPFTYLFAIPSIIHCFISYGFGVVASKLITRARRHENPANAKA